MSMLLFDIPIPIVSEIGNGYILYVKGNGYLEEDEFTCVMQKDGSIKHFTSSQIKIWKNATYKIEKDEQK